MNIRVIKTSVKTKSYFIIASNKVKLSENDFAAGRNFV